MKKALLLLSTVLVLMMYTFGASLHAEIRYCDFSNPKNHNIDGWDLSQFIASYTAADSSADVNGDGRVDSNDVAHFAGFFGISHAPNILLIIADDVGIDLTTGLYQTLIEELIGLYGSSGWNHPNAGDIDGHPASTPKLDQLAQHSMVFSNTWAQPFCSPSRAAIITGLFANKTDVVSPGNPMSINHTTFVKLLQNEGYGTALFGKWHLGTGGTNGALPKQSGFDLFKGHTGGDLWRWSFWNYSYHVQDDATTDPTTYRTESAPTRSLPGIAATTFAPVVKAADTIEWITTQEATEPDKPWFVWLAFNEVHTPMHVPNADTLDPASYTEVTGCGGVPGTTDRGSCSDKVIIRAMTNAMDTVIGKVLDAIEDPNTYIIFIGDNGTDNAIGSTRSLGIDNMYLTTEGRGKGTVYESGARVPMAISGPGIMAESESSEFVHATDLYNTCLNIAGLPSETQNQDINQNPVTSDSKSLTPILFDSARALRDPNEGYLLTETYWPETNFDWIYKVGARNAIYKVVCTRSASNCQFYNLVSDPLEEYPLSQPSSCATFRTSWSTEDEEWHYCRLIEIVNLYSIFP